MTEKQGGSDVRANTTTATPLNGGGAGAEYEIVGHKWFCSAPMCDLFLVLAQTDEGISCFAMPRILPDGTRNEFHIQRLKDKLGNRSNASSEVEFHGAWARMVGEPGRGVPTIIEMVGHTRLDCVLGAAAGMRAGRRAGDLARRAPPRLRQAPRRAAADGQRARRPRDRGRGRERAGAAPRARLRPRGRGRERGAHQAPRRRRSASTTSASARPNHAFESLEVFGGAGFVEESGMPRLYREAPLCSIWEGSGNVMALDVLRALARDAGRARRLPRRGRPRRRRRRAGSTPSRRALRARARPTREALETRARRLVEGLALALQGSLLLRGAPPAVADAFCAARLGGERRHALRHAARGRRRRGDRRAPHAAGLSADGRTRGARVRSGRVRRAQPSAVRVFGIRIGASTSWFLSCS